MTASIEKLAWAAGVIDGEGCISLTRRSPQTTNGSVNPNYRLILKVTMCHEPTIRRLHKIFGKGTIQSQKQLHSYWSQPWIWMCNATDAGEVLELILPLLFTKKAEGKAALEFLAKTDRNRAGKARTLTAAEITIREKYFNILHELKSSNISKRKRALYEAEL